MPEHADCEVELHDECEVELHDEDKLGEGGPGITRSCTYAANMDSRSATVQGSGSAGLAWIGDDLGYGVT